ncbi:hypothetical protein [Paraconexibacter algicola]|uniref:hypothetical protein n=1 Tax=Paraconexibacter algicola TaxID=2133960 RepID=UPI0011B20EAD|nr:hypothetical protein [Paraconexibacter algicola]
MPPSPSPRPAQVPAPPPADRVATDPPGSAPPLALRVRAVALVAAMAVGSIVLWIGIPVLWILLGGLISTPGTPSFAPIALVLVATPVSMAFFAPLLGRLDHAHRELRGALRDGPRRAAWNTSMRDSQDTTAQDGILERVMVVSVALAVAVAGGYLALFGGSMSVPGT